MVKKPRKKPEPRERILNAALTLADEFGWRHVSMHEIAERAEVGIADLLREFPSKTAISAGVFSRLDEAVVAGVPNDLADMGDSPRDRLFDVLMARFDAARAYKSGLAAMLVDQLCDPIAIACQAPRYRRSMSLMLEAAGVPASGVCGLLRAKGLGFVYANAVRVWLRDDSTDLTPTMAALDRGLRQAERIACALWRNRAEA